MSGITISVPALYRTDLLAGQTAAQVAANIAEAFGLDGTYQLEQNGTPVPDDTVLDVSTGDYVLAPHA